MSKSFVGKNSNIVTNIIESSSNDLILKSQNTNLYDVVINDEIKVDEIKTNKKDKVLINDLRTNCIKIGSDNNYINMIKYYNNCIQILGSDSDSNKIIIGYNIENDEQKAFINTITLSSRGNIQCNKLITNEIQASNLHEHENKAYLDSINQNLSKTSNVQFNNIKI